MKAVFVAIFLFITPAIAAENLSCRELFALATGGSSALIKNRPMFKLMYLPGKKLASTPGVEIAGFLKNAGTFKEVAEKLAQRLERFDRDMEGLGFIAPELFRIVLFNKAPSPIFPRTRLIYNLNIPIFNLWRGKTQGVIVVDPPNPHYLHELIHSADIILHERAHNILRQTYGKDSFVIGNGFIDEALADFFATHALDDPQVGRYFFPRQSSSERY